MKRLLFFSVIALCSTAVFGQSEELDIYTYLYNNAINNIDRLGILQSVAEAKVPGAGELYAQALNDLVRDQPNIRGASERDTADAIARLTAGLLGEEKHVAAAGDIWRMIQVFSNPLVKSDGLIALGRMRAMDFLPQITRLLSDTNLRPSADRDAGEKIAFGAIIALEKYQDTSGYLPVFFAATGWYSGRVKEQAAASLQVILADPSEPLTTIINSSSYTYDVKYLALKTAEDSEMPDSSKSAIAGRALAEGWRSATNDPRQRMELANMRKLAINMIQKYGSGDSPVYPYLERSYKEGIDMEEKLTTVATLGILASDDSARLLSSFLMIINGRLQSGTLTREDEQLVRALIPALGMTGKSSARPALRAVQTLDWTPAVKNLAADALTKIQ